MRLSEKIRIALAILLLSAAGLIACSSEPADSQEKKQLAEIAQFINVDFPADAKIIHSEKNDRNNEAAYRHIIFTPKTSKI